MRWEGRALRATAVSVAAQLVAAVALSLAVGAVWARSDGTALTARWSDTMAIGGALWGVGGWSIAPRMSAMAYQRFGFSERRERSSGRDVGAGGGGVLTPFGEAVLVGTILLVLSVLVY